MLCAMDQTKAVFIPEFEKGVYKQNGVTGARIGVNNDLFATEATAHYIAEKFGDGAIYEADLIGPNGPDWCSAKMRMIMFTPEYPGKGDPPEPRLVNAGFLAAYYVRNPEAERPGLAEKMIRAQLKTLV